MENSDRNELPYKYDAWCKTGFMKSENYTFVWSISDFSSRSESNGYLLTSEEFAIKGPDDKISRWRVELYPKGRDYSDHIALFLRKQTAEEEVNAQYVLYSLDANKVKQKIRGSGPIKFGVGENKGWGWDKAIKRSDLFKHTPDDTLTVFYEITIIGKTKKSIDFTKKEKKCLPLTDEYHQKQLLHDFSMLNLTKDHSDVIVRCGSKVYNCHKNILASRSPVFKSMLEVNMKEKASGNIEIENMETAVLEDLLEYIYSGVAPNVEAHAQELFAAADQYQLETLKELCEVKICEKIDISNCIDHLFLGYLHNARKLKAAALEYVSKNIQKIKTCDWKEILIAHPALMAEVMEMMVPKIEE